MGNVNSLANKADKLAALVKNQTTNGKCSLLCLTETWLTGNTSDANVDIPRLRLTTVRADRDAKLCGKREGGGLALLINIRWFNLGHVTVKEMICCQDIELLVVSLWPCYMPREFLHTIAVCVYIRPGVEAGTACEAIQPLRGCKCNTRRPSLPYQVILIMLPWIHHSLCFIIM